MLAYRFGPQGGRALWHAGSLLTFKAAAADTGGRFWLMEQVAPRGRLAPLHSHAREDVAGYVLEGTLMCAVGEQAFRASPGTFMYVPRGVVHTFRVETPTARLLLLGTPAGAEDFFWETGEPAGALTIPPTRLLIDPACLGAACATYGVDIPASRGPELEQRWGSDTENGQDRQRTQTHRLHIRK